MHILVNSLYPPIAVYHEYPNSFFVGANSKIYSLKGFFHRASNIKQRQAEGIRIAKEKGVKFGRSKVVLPSNTNEILKNYINKEITNIKAAKIIGISRGTSFRIVKEYKN